MFFIFLATKFEIKILNTIQIFNMKENFTLKRIMSFMMSMAFVCLVTQMDGQLVNTLTINEPLSIAADYPVIIGTFGEQRTQPLTGPGALIDDGTEPVNDGCEPGASNVSGKIAFVDRGACQFGTKALFAENAGASAIIICNTATGDLLTPIAGDDGADVNAPVFMMSFDNCQTIKVELANADVNATIQYKCLPPSYGSEVIWGTNSGEGDFAGGLPADWSIERPPNLDPAIESWFWEPTGTATGLFTNFTITSATACNGAMVMSSDDLDNGGGDIASGPCPGPCTASLVSPTIDISGADPAKGFFLQFTQAFRQFTSQYNIVLSKNDGVTWPDTLALNTDAVVNSANINETIKIPLEGYAGVQNLKFKFEYVGNYYYWVIDDVALTNESYVDMQLNSNWYAAPPSWRVPASQVSEMPFIVDIFNNGNEAAQNVEVRVDIYDETGANINTSTKDYGTVPIYSIDENNVFDADQSWTPPSTPGLYTGYYVISAESGDPDIPGNLNTANDSIEFSLEVTEDKFASALSEAEGNLNTDSFTGNSTWGNPTNDAFTAAMGVGSVYYMPNGDGYDVKSLTFGVTDADLPQSGFVHAQMFKWFGDLDGDGFMDTDERELVGANTLIVDTLIANGVSDPRAITIPIFDINNTGAPVPGTTVDLEDDSQYMFVLLCQPLTAGIQSIDLIGAANTNGFERTYNTFATNMAFDSTFVDRRAGTYITAMTSGTTMEFSSLAPEFWSIMTLWTEVVIGFPTGTEDLNDNIALLAFPNPASDLVTVNVGLTSPSAIDIEIINLEGKRVQHDSFESRQVGSVVLNISNIPNGVYILNVRSDEGMKSQKIIVQK